MKTKQVVLLFDGSPGSARELATLMKEGFKIKSVTAGSVTVSVTIERSPYRIVHGKFLLVLEKDE